MFRFMKTLCLQKYNLLNYIYNCNTNIQENKNQIKKTKKVKLILAEKEKKPHQID